jgi:hypothetical protein
MSNEINEDSRHPVQRQFRKLTTYVALGPYGGRGAAILSFNLKNCNN